MKKQSPVEQSSPVKHLCGGVGLMGAAYVLYKLSIIAYHVYLLLNPEMVKDPFALPASREGVHETCQTPFRHITTVHNVHSYEEVVRIAKERYEPILFKGFAKNMDERWKRIVDLSDHVPVRFGDVNITSFGNTFMKGIEVVGDLNMTLGEAVALAEDPEYTKSGKSFFASFVPFLSKEAMKIALNSTDADLFKIDTNFVSNFAEDVLATHVHAALVESHSIQLVGSKMWVFFSPDDFETLNPINTPTIWCLSGSEKKYFDSVKGGVPVAVQEAGDYLYFPPMWGHSVITKAGTNVMLNMRQHPSRFPKHVFRALEAVLSVLIVDGWAFSKPYSHAVYRPVQQQFNLYEKAHREANPDRKVPDSPCAGLWKDMLNGRVGM